MSELESRIIGSEWGPEMLPRKRKAALAPKRISTMNELSE